MTETIFSILLSIAMMFGVIYLLILAIEKIPFVRVLIWGAIIFGLLMWLGFGTLLKWVGIVALIGVICWLKEEIFG